MKQKYGTAGFVQPVTATQSSRILPSKQQDEIVELYINEECEKKIRHLCNKFPSLEWSGILFYKTIEGDIGSDLKLEAMDLFPLNLGSQGFTESRANTHLAGYIAENEDTHFNYRQGFIHSHNSMGTNFSGTDIQQLIEGVIDFGNFLSLIVNNEGTYNAKLSVKAKEKIQTRQSFLAKNFNFMNRSWENTEDKEEDVALLYDCLVERRDIVAIEDQLFLDAVKRIQEERDAAITPRAYGWSGQQSKMAYGDDAYGQDSYGSYGNYDYNNDYYKRYGFHTAKAPAQVSQPVHNIVNSPVYDKYLVTPRKLDEKELDDLDAYIDRKGKGKSKAPKKLRL
jgi:hypothetical protein